jgi:hypothetical protein
MIMSTLRQNELVALANDLEALDLQTFRARLPAGAQRRAVSSTSGRAPPP